MKSKKITVLLLTAALLLCGCGTPSLSPQPEPTAEPSPTPVPAPSFAEQEKLIMENEALWKKPQPYYDFWSYALTDLTRPADSAQNCVAFSGR